jgi:hypothetical protein
MPVSPIPPRAVCNNDDDGGWSRKPLTPTKRCFVEGSDPADAAACFKLKQGSMVSVNFTDTQLQACFERNLAGTEATDELRQVRALMATYDWFRVLEGPHTQRVHDTIDLLLSRELRPSLHQWYGRPGACLEGAEAIAARDHLSFLAGEKLEL